MRLDAESPRELVAEAEGHLRALLRDVLCGYLDADLKGVADDILLEAGPEPFMGAEAHEIEARDLRKEPRFERERSRAASPSRTSGPSRTSTTGPTPSTSRRTRVRRRADTSARARLRRPSSTPSRHAELEAVTVAPSPCSTSWTA